MNKNIITVVCLAMAFMMLLSACGGGATTAGTTAAATTTAAAAAAETTAAQTQADSASAQEGQTPILFWFPHGGSPDKETLEGMVDDFNVKYPEYIATGEYIGSSGAGVGMTDKLMTAIAGGNPPDVVLFDRFMVGQWASQALFEDITSEASAAGVVPDLFYDFAWQEASLEGKLYAMPFDTDNRALYYNIDMLSEAGFEPPKTIAEMDEIADALTIKEGNRYSRFGLIPWLSQGFLYTWGAAFGGKFQDEETGKITFDDPKIVEALEWMVTYATKYGIESITDFTNATSGSDINPFAGELVAMYVSGPWEISGFKLKVPDLNYGVVPIPTPTGTGYTCMAGGWSMIIPVGTKVKPAAFALAKYLTVEEGGIRYGEDTTHFMCKVDINENLSWVKNEPIFNVFIELFPTSFCRPVIPKGQLLWDEQMTAQDNALNKVDTPLNLLKAMTDKVNAELGYN